MGDQSAEYYGAHGGGRSSGIELQRALARIPYAVFRGISNVLPPSPKARHRQFCELTCITLRPNARLARKEERWKRSFLDTTSPLKVAAFDALMCGNGNGDGVATAHERGGRVHGSLSVTPTTPNPNPKFNPVERPPRQTSGTFHCDAYPKGHQS